MGLDLPNQQEGIDNGSMSQRDGGSFRVGNQAESEREVLKQGVVRRLKRKEKKIHPEKRSSSRLMSARAIKREGDQSEERVGNVKGFAPSDNEL